jgi:hypothetical protein
VLPRPRLLLGLLRRIAPSGSLWHAAEATATATDAATEAAATTNDVAAGTAAHPCSSGWSWEMHAVRWHQ